MAEFCKQCAEEMGFEPDFVNLTDEQEEAAGLYACVLCETCGPIQVNRKGECISDDCFCRGPKGEHSDKFFSREKFKSTFKCESLNG